MPNTSPSNHVSRIASPKHRNIPMRKSTNYTDLLNELKRLRTELTRETMMPHLITTEPELFPEPVDQAAAEHDLDISLSVKLLAIEKVRRIESALTSLHANSSEKVHDSTKGGHGNRSPLLTTVYQGATMRCTRCAGLRVPEIIYEGGSRVPALRCVHCGDVIDHVIALNRRRPYPKPSRGRTHICGIDLWKKNTSTLV